MPPLLIFRVEAPVAKNWMFRAAGSSIFDMSFNSDGTKLYFLGANETVHLYNLTVAWDVSSGSYSGTSLDLSADVSDGQGFSFADNGAFLLVVDEDNDEILTFVLAAPYDISAAVKVSAQTLDVNNQTILPLHVHMNTTGTKLYVTGANISASIIDIFQYNIADVTDYSYVS